MKKILMMLLGVAFATFAWALDPVTYLTWDASKKKLVEATCSSYTVVTESTATLGNGWYVVQAEDYIERYSTIKVTGAAHLILCDGSNLIAKGEDSQAGIEVPANTSLTIYGQSTGDFAGYLGAIGGEGGAGIGGKKNGTCGTITINGGSIDAFGGEGGACIGGGFLNTNAAKITINDGNITGAAGECAAAIGSGSYNDRTFDKRPGTDTIEINGGTIIMTGSSSGIGSGWDGFATMVTINGGEIVVYGDIGIGGAFYNKEAVSITINGGKIDATSVSVGGAGIGSGNYDSEGWDRGTRSGTDTITINGGTIKAVALLDGAGIGSGAEGFATTVTINGGEITASTANADAIGSGNNARAKANVAFSSTVEFSIMVAMAGESVDKATPKTVDSFKKDHSAPYAKIVGGDSVTYLTWD